jgi:hypothetical protein
MKIIIAKKSEPKMETLKENRRTLTPEERKKVMDAGAIWHHDHNEEDSPGVWKAVVDGKEWFVCNTHRAYQCKPTIEGAINAFDFIETTSSFNGEIKMADTLFKFAGRKRIKDRGINWKEHYHVRSAKLKKRFDRDIGSMAYMRWEGHDYTTNSDYFIVLGPALTKDGKKKFFAGIKKLPKDPKAKIYAPSGKYFDSINDAMGHANFKWGVAFPMNPKLPKYTVADLIPVNIPRHVKG